MSETVANSIVWIGAAYAAAGLLFAIPFVLAGAGRIDPVAARGTWGFRVLILPGSAALWPYLLLRWVRRPGAPPVESNPHRDAATEARA